MAAELIKQLQSHLECASKPVAIAGYTAPFTWVDVATAVGTIYICSALLKLAYNAISAVVSPLFRKSPRSYGEWAIVTGGSDGIGLGYATALAKKGLKVVLIARNAGKLAEAKAAIEGKVKGATVLTISADLAQAPESGIFAKLKTDLEAAGVLAKVGILINNAGVSYPGALYFNELDQYAPGLRSKMININVTAVTELTAMVLPFMVKNKKGAVINVASAAGRVPIGNPLYAEYSASKAYVDYFSRSLHHELKGTGVHVQCQSPYFVATELSGIRKASLTAPKASVYGAAAVGDIGSGDSTVPYWPHGLQDAVIQVLPKPLLSYYLNSLHKDLRKRYFRKLERIAAGEQAKDGGAKNKKQ